MHIGFIGLGNMGLPMATNLLEAGLEVTVYNRTRSRAEQLESRGAGIADSIEQLVGRVELVATCLADVPVTRELWLGAGGVLEHAREGQLLVDHATVDLATSREIASAAKERGAHFLDAPISGGPGGAKAGTLSIMVGGAKEAYRNALTAFQAMGQTVVHMGPTGSGTATKLANQLLVGVHTLATCEAFTLAREAGVNLERLEEVLGRSWGQSRMVERNAPEIIARAFGPSPVPLRNLLKDLSIITELGETLSVALPAARAALEQYSELADSGKGEWDISAACLLLEPRRRT